MRNDTIRHLPCAMGDRERTVLRRHARMDVLRPILALREDFHRLGG
jgi:hypothetical protein